MKKVLLELKMKKEEKKSKTYEQFYEYFMNGFDGNYYKPVAVISSKQCALTSDRAQNGNDHVDMARNITNAMGYGKHTDSRNAHFFGVGGAHTGEMGFMIELPNSNNTGISFAQYSFISDILSAYEDALPNAKRELSLQLFSTGEVIEDDIKQMREELENRLEKQIRTSKSEERIISEKDSNMIVSTLDKDTIKEGLLFDFDLENTESLNQLSAKFSLLSNYYQTDPYYQDAVNELFPDLDSIAKASTILGRQGVTDLEDYSAEGLSETIKGKLSELYREKQKVCEETQRELKTLSSKYKELEREEDTDVAFDGLYSKKQESNSRLQDYSQKIADIENRINLLNSEISENSLIVNPESKTMFQRMRNIFTRVFNRKKITNSENTISNNSVEISKLEEELKSIKQEMKAEEQKNLRMEMEFKSISGKEMTLEDYKIERAKKIDGSKEKVDNTDEKNKIQDRMQELLPVLSAQRSELEEIRETGLIEEEKIQEVDTREESI